jgi:hypothetical protein
MKHKEARTDMTYSAVSVTVTSQKISLSTGMAGKEYMMISNTGSKACWIGDSTVTATNGYQINPKGAYDFGLCTPLFAFYVVSGSNTTLGVFQT